MLRSIALILLFITAGCSQEPDPKTSQTDDAQDIEDGGTVEDPHRDIASAHFLKLSKATTIEEERLAVTEFAAWLNANNYKLEIDEQDGTYTLACPYFPPVTPWTEHTFLDSQNLSLLPRQESE